MSTDGALRRAVEAGEGPGVVALAAAQDGKCYEGASEHGAFAALGKA